MAAALRKPATFDDLVLRGDPDRLEIIHGEVVEKAVPSPEHSFAEAKLVASVDPFNRKPGGNGPGGWWIFTEIHVSYPHGEVYCHDCAGWRRDRIATRPAGWPVRNRPHWVAEILSPKHERRDIVDKAFVLHAAEVPHYWIIDPEEQSLLVQRWSREGYVVVLRAVAGETVRAEPFDAIELAVGALLDDE